MGLLLAFCAAMLLLHATQVHRPCLMGFFPVILKHLYDADIVEEEAMLMWAGEEGRSEEYTPSSLTDEQVSLLRNKAAPFITWLEEADEEDDDDEVCCFVRGRLVICVMGSVVCFTLYSSDK